MRAKLYEWEGAEPSIIRRMINKTYRCVSVCTLVLSCLLCVRTLSAHTFTAIAADLLYNENELSMTLGLNILDVIAIITNSPTTAGTKLSHSELIADMPAVQAYLEKYVHVSVNGKRISGQCLGYIPDLTDPPKPGQPLAETLPDRLPFLLIWTLPADAKQCDVQFDLLIDVVGTGVVHANFHDGSSTQSLFRDLGAIATFDLPGTTLNPDNVRAEPQPQTTSTMGVWTLLKIGFLHIVPFGLDHIVFVVCLFLLSPKLKPLLIQVTAFTIAHSVTLGMAMMGWVLLPSRWVESLIALSIVVMAVENLFMRDVKPWRWIVVFVFGLIHGLGFAGSFSEIQLSEGHVAIPLLLLNIGIEIGQLCVVAACALLTCWAWKKPWYRQAIILPASGAFAGLGCWWVIERVFAL